MVDCISGGRVECGMVRGVPYELFAANTNPTQTNERLWEGVEMVTRAWTNHDGPFNFEGRFWHRRNINIWPRPYQRPRPRIWITGSNDLENIRMVAEKGHVFATFLQPFAKVRELFDLYRQHYRSNGLAGGVAYMPLVYVADNEEDAMKGADEIAWYMRMKDEPQFRNPPGYVGREFNVRALKGAFTGRTDAMTAMGLDYLREQGVIIAGTPDSVVSQIERLHTRLGGVDHLLMMMQCGFLDHAKTVSNIKMFAREVYPRVRHLPATTHE